MFSRAILFAVIGVLVWLIWMQLKKSLLSDPGTRGKKQTTKQKIMKVANLEQDPKTGKYRLSRSDRDDEIR